MAENQVIFYLSAVSIISFALFSMIAKKIISSLLWAILVFFMSAVIFYVLGSEYNAIIQAAIYGIAVPIILGISIMFSANKSDTGKGFSFSFVVILFGFLFALLLADCVIISLIKLPETFIVHEPAQGNFYNVISIFAKGLFINYVWAFELMGLLLTVLIVGISVYRKKGA